MQVAEENGYADLSDELRTIEKKELEYRKAVGNVKFESVEKADEARDEKKKIDDAVVESAPFDEKIRQFYHLDKSIFETEFSQVYLADLQMTMKSELAKMLSQSKNIKMRRRNFTGSVIFAVIVDNVDISLTIVYN